MAIDLKSMSLKELQKHLTEVKKAVATAQARSRRDAKRAAEKAAAEFGFTLSDFAEDAPKPRKQRKTKTTGPKKKSKPQFANPSDATQTWTGKGRQPNWFRAEIEKGTSADSMKI